LTGKSWFSSLFFFINLQKDIGYLAHTWYLATDMQLFLLSLLLLPLFAKRAELTKFLIFTIIGISVVERSLFHYIHDVPIETSGMTNEKQVESYITNMYVKPLTHAGPYLVGILFAFELNRSKGAINLSTPMSLFSCVIFVAQYLPPFINWSPVGSAIFAGTIRTLVAISLIWVINFCIKRPSSKQEKEFLLTHDIN